LTETFIGGFTSGFLAQGLMGVRVGYGLYFTSTRLFGMSAARWAGGSLGGTSGGMILGELMPSLTPEQTETVLGELERDKDLELARAELQSIVLKKPGPAGMGLGKITIQPVQGKAVSYLLRHPIAYARLLQLTQAFSPELLRTKPFLSF
jgi:hypothetical protein